MGHWTDLPAVWHQAADNFGDGDYTTNEQADRMAAVNGIALHIAQGSGAGTVSWCANPSSDVGPHFVVAEDGTITQMVDTTDYSWCQAAGNRYWLSVENAGWSGNPLTAGQVEANARILAKAHQVYGVPLQATDDVNGRGLGWHGMGGAAWGGHYDCPGEPIKAQRGAIIARAQQIIDGGGSMVSELWTGMQTSRGPNTVGNAVFEGDFAAQDALAAIRAFAADETTRDGVEAAKLAEVDQAVDHLVTVLDALAARPSATLSAEQLAAIGSSAGVQAATVIGARIDSLEAKIVEVRALVAAMVMAFGGVGGVLQTLQSVSVDDEADDGSDASAS